MFYVGVTVELLFQILDPDKNIIITFLLYFTEPQKKDYCSLPINQWSQCGHINILTTYFSNVSFLENAPSVYLQLLKKTSPGCCFFVVLHCKVSFSYHLPILFYANTLLCCGKQFLESVLLSLPAANKNSINNITQWLYFSFIYCFIFLPMLKAKVLMF